MRRRGAPAEPEGRPTVSAVSHSDGTWAGGREPAHQIVALGVATTLTAVALDVILSGRLTLFFDLCFVALCLGLAALVRRGDFFAVGLLPPALMVVVFCFLALVARDTIADPRDNLPQAVITGVAHHSAALAVGYALCLGCLVWRIRRESSGSLSDLVG